MRDGVDAIVRNTARIGSTSTRFSIPRIRKRPAASRHAMAASCATSTSSTADSSALRRERPRASIPAASAARSVMGSAGTRPGRRHRAFNAPRPASILASAPPYNLICRLRGAIRIAQRRFGSGIAHSGRERTPVRTCSGYSSGAGLAVDTAYRRPWSRTICLSGSCEPAIAGWRLRGGANLILAPELFIALSHSRMLAPDGRCKTFSGPAAGMAFPAARAAVSSC